MDEPTLVVVCIKTASSKSSQKALHWAFRNPLGLKNLSILVLHVFQKKRREDGELVLSQLAKRNAESKINYKTELVEVDRHGIGHTIKAYCREVGTKLLVIGDSFRKTPLRSYLAECDCFCPVIFVRSDSPQGEDNSRYANIAVGVTQQQCSLDGVKWLLENIEIPKPSQVVLCHVVTHRDEKAEGREFLNSFKPDCKGKRYAIRSALVYARKEKTVSGGFQTFVHERKIELAFLSPKPQGGKKARAGGKITNHCLDSFLCDILLYKDQTTNAQERQTKQGTTPSSFLENITPSNFLDSLSSEKDRDKGGGWIALSDSSEHGR